MEVENGYGTELHNWNMIKRSDGKVSGVKGNRNGVSGRNREKAELAFPLSPTLGLFSPKDGERRKGMKRSGLVRILLVESVDGVLGVLKVESRHPGVRVVCIIVSKPFDKVHERAGFPPEIHL